jgi:hypothetical protein
LAVDDHLDSSRDEDALSARELKPHRLQKNRELAQKPSATIGAQP